MAYSLVIVDNLYCFWSTIGPNKANTILVIDPYAVLTFPLAAQCLKSISWRHTKVIQMGSGVELLKLEERSAFQLLWQGSSGVFGRSSVEDIFCATIAKASDHVNMITRISCQLNSPVTLTPVSSLWMFPGFNFVPAVRNLHTCLSN